jgi:MFS family permease
MSSRASSSPTDLRRARVAVGSAFFVHGAIATSWASRIPSVKADLGLSEAGLGFALLGPALGALLAIPLGGAVTARRGSRSVTRAMLVAHAAAVVLPVAAPNLLLLFVELVVYGASGGVMDVAMNAQGVALEKRYERPILSGFHALWSLGGFAGALVGSAAAEAGLEPVAHLGRVAGALVIAGLVATARLLPAEADRSLEGPKFARPAGALAVMGAVAFCAMLAEGAALDWSAVYVRESLRGSHTLAAVAVGAFSLGMCLGRIVGDRLTMRFGATAFVQGAAAVALAGLVGALSARGPMQGVVGFGIMGVGMSSIVPVIFSRAGHASRFTGAPGIATVATMGYTAFLVGPSLVGGVAELTSLRSALAGVACLLAAVPFLGRSAEIR